MRPRTTVPACSARTRSPFSSLVLLLAAVLFPGTRAHAERPRTDNGVPPPSCDEGLIANIFLQSANFPLKGTTIQLTAAAPSSSW